VNGPYSDEIAASSAWVSFYQGQLTGGNTCEWSWNQEMDYNGQQFAYNTNGVTVSSSDYWTNRAACTVEGPTQGSSGCGN
jgi:hypothetical protein